MISPELAITNITLFFLLVASWFDIKTGEIPDWISIAMIISILALRMIFSFHVLQGLIFMGAFILLGNFLYNRKILGGGDAKLLFSLGMALPIYQSFFHNIYAVCIFLGVVFIIGFVYVSTFGMGKKKKVQLPFAPAMLLGFLIYLLLMK